MQKNPESKDSFRGEEEFLKAPFFMQVARKQGFFKAHWVCEIMDFQHKMLDPNI
jgi:hypothetical protein